MRARQGFTLIEIAVVLFLIGLLMAAGVRYLNSQLTSAAYSVTDKRLDTIKDALITYLRKNRRLPCPDEPTDDALLIGKDSRDTSGTPNNCFHHFGVIPYSELGLSKDVALDGWGNYFSYAVSPQWTLTLAPAVAAKTTTSPGLSFSVGIPGALTVNTNGPTPIADPLFNNGAAVVVISYGKNGSGAYTVKGSANADPETAEEVENLERNADTHADIFYKREYADVFDDVVAVIMPDDLTGPLVKEGSAASAVTLNQKFSTISDAIMGYTLSHVTAGNHILPSQFSDITGLSVADPYGCGDIVYLTHLNSINSLTNDPTTATSAFQLQSCGPTSDIYTMDISTFRGLLGKNAAF